ncbi:MAG: 30S ribosomal protein S11 [Fimbriimonadaceae bacterium]|nr:30S ribosomal protein S11 [Armatimonadota bacterium]
MARKQASKAKAKEKRQVPHGRAYVHSTFNNTIVTVTDPQGNALCWSSAGNAGFKGSRKGTPFAAQLAAEKVAKKAAEFSMESIDVFVSGPGGGRETAIRSLHANGLDVKSVRDVTPVPHNGCRPPKKRRV